ncbi:pimeloyl-ACP methyl ester carboxylesterase [Nocardioides cavernae]|uniref:Pimeloyl-ACP methyl ester carboxylesterase n=1 Tax=Nocardioides cavernae TaxID=1921566 RepID=A0A7Y9H480_9ACTN|nr:lipase family protein [Nocardioides cavernae]NYE37336.1 pimeloyl-ACP methyl ester carboxylesterase [Nocardioides cavernae]
MLRRATTSLVTLIAATLSITSAVVATGTTAAGAAVDEPPRPAFYEAPATLPPADGDVIRSERMSFLLDPLDATSLVRNAQRVLYRTTDRTGEAIAASGTVLVPNAPWVGVGSRPVIGYAPGTQGMADRCAPSRLFSEGIEYEGIGIEGLLLRGYAVAMPDYEGLGTAGVHTYMDRVSQGHATLDVVRAAQRLPGTGLSSASPVGLMGYSQGGGAAASAAELAASYAPDLRVRGAVVGAVPADLSRVATTLDGGLYSAFAFFALRGLSASYDLDLSPYLNARGRATSDQVEQECVFDLLDHAFVRSSTLSADGRPMSELMAREPFRSIVEAQRIGTIRPAFPVLVTHSTLDDVIPYAVGRSMARSWCAKGANVRFSPNLAPLHVGGIVPQTAEALPFFEARFAGLPQVGNCWLL